MNNLDESRIEQPSLVQALDKYREMEKVLEEEYDSLQDVIIQSSNEWQGAASKALISEMEYFLNEGDYNTAYENVKTMRMCMEDTLEQVNALLARSEEFPKQLKSSTYIEPMRPAMGDNTVRNGGVLYLDYGKARLIPGLCDQVYEAAEYLGNVLKQHMEVCSGIMDGIPTYISRVDKAVKKVKRIENYKFSFQKYVQDVMALENDVAVRLAGMKGESKSSLNDDKVTREMPEDAENVRKYVGGLNGKVFGAELSLAKERKLFLGLTAIMTVGEETVKDEIFSYIGELKKLYKDGTILEDDYFYIMMCIQAYQHAPTEVQNIIKSQLLSKCEEIKVGLALKEYIQQSNKEYTYDFIKMYNEGYFSQEDYEYFKFCINTCENVAENERKEILEQLVNKYAELECIYILKLNFEELNITDIEEQQKICNVVGTMNPTMLQKISDFQNMSEEQIKEHVSNLIDYYNNKIHLYITPEDVKTLSFCDEKGKYHGLDETQQQVFLSFWYTLVEMDLTYEQIVGVLANIYEESKFSCTNAQDSWGYKGKYNEDYFFNVDDKIGYGLLQWTLSDRKKGLLNMAIEQGGSVSDLNIQLAYFKEEMLTSVPYKTYWLEFLNKETINDATYFYMDVIESPDVNNIEDRMLYANSIVEWYEREVLKAE